MCYCVGARFVLLPERGYEHLKYFISELIPQQWCHYGLKMVAIDQNVFVWTAVLDSVLLYQIITTYIYKNRQFAINTEYKKQLNKLK